MCVVDEIKRQIGNKSPLYFLRDVLNPYLSYETKAGKYGCEIFASMQKRKTLLYQEDKRTITIECGSTCFVCNFEYSAGINSWTRTKESIERFDHTIDKMIANKEHERLKDIARKALSSINIESLLFDDEEYELRDRFVFVLMTLYLIKETSLSVIK